MPRRCVTCGRCGRPRAVARPDNDLPRTLDLRTRSIRLFFGRTFDRLAVHIRLRRVGKTKAPTYRVVIADSRAPRNGKFIESIGHYDPLREPVELVIDPERARHWIKNGARPTATARSLLVKSGLSDSEVPPTVR